MSFWDRVPRNINDFEAAIRAVPGVAWVFIEVVDTHLSIKIANRCGRVDRSLIKAVVSTVLAPVGYTASVAGPDGQLKTDLAPLWYPIQEVNR